MTQLVEKRISKNAISIQPYTEANIENMGLEKYDMVLHQGATHKEFLTCLEIHGRKRYLNGLDEFAPEVENLKDPEVKKAKINQIREKVIFLERALAGNDKLKVADKDFWSNVEVVRRDNHEFWGKVTIEVGNDKVYLDEKDPNDLILISCIEAGGFSEIAPSYEDAKGGSISYKWYLDKKKESSAAKTSGKKIKNEAIAILDSIFKKDSTKLRYLAKCIDGNSVQYKNDTPIDVIYDNLDSFINGHGIERTVTKAANIFIDASKLDMETLRVKAIIRDAAVYKFIIHKPDGNLYHNTSGNMLGKTQADCIEYFKNAMNAKLWEKLEEEVQAYWD